MMSLDISVLKGKT